MSTVHIFSKPMHYYSGDTLALINSVSDSILLTGDACYDQASFTSVLAKHLFALKTCHEARHLKTLDSIQYISDTDWVDLLANNKSISW